jgi:hypothetical protein
MGIVDGLHENNQHAGPTRGFYQPQNAWHPLVLQNPHIAKDLIEKAAIGDKVVPHVNDEKRAVPRVRFLGKRP